MKIVRSTENVMSLLVKNKVYLVVDIPFTNCYTLMKSTYSSCNKIWNKDRFEAVSILNNRITELIHD